MRISLYFFGLAFLIALPFVPVSVQAETLTPQQIQQQIDLITQQIADLQNQLNQLLAASTSTPPAVSPSSNIPSSFQPQDPIITNRFLNVRATPSITGLLLGTMPKGTDGIILEGPVSASGYTWYRVAFDYDVGLTGWSADLGLEKRVPKQEVVITSVTPLQGPVGTVVNISGVGFTAANNTFNVTLPSGATTTVRDVSASQGGGGTMQFLGGIVPNQLNGFPVTPGILTFSVSNANGTSNIVSFTVTGSGGGVSLTPTLTDITPSVFSIGDLVTLEYHGSNFQSGAVIVFSGPMSGIASAEFVSDTELQQTGTSPIPSSTLPGVYTIQIRNPNGETSNSMTLTINSIPTFAPIPTPVPTPTPTLTPAPAQIGQPTYTLLPTPSSRLVIANGEVLYRFSVSAPTNASTAITQFPLTITHTSGVLLNSAAIYAYTNSNFSQSAYTADGSSIASWSGSLDNTTNTITMPVNSAVGSAVIPAGATYYFELRALVTAVPAGSSITTTLSGLSGTTLTSAASTPLPAPSLSSITPNTFTVGDTVTLNYNGLNFKDGAIIVFSGPMSGIASTEFISASQLRQTGTSPIPASTLSGTYSIQIKNPDGQVSNIMTIVIKPQPAIAAPKITGLTKSVGPVGTVFDIKGTGFTATNNEFNIKLPTGEILRAPGVASSENGTKFAGAGIPDQLSGIRIAPGTLRFSVSNQNGTSNEVTFTVTGPILKSITPTYGPVGSSVTAAGNGLALTGNVIHYVLTSGFTGALPAVPAKISTDGVGTITLSVPTVLSNAGAVRLWITNALGQSNELWFKVTTSIAGGGDR